MDRPYGVIFTHLHAALLEQLPKDIAEVAVGGAGNAELACQGLRFQGLVGFLGNGGQDLVFKIWHVAEVMGQ